MRYLHHLLLPLFLLMLLPHAAQGSDNIIAEFGNIKLSAEQFKKYPLPAVPAQRRQALKRMVDTHVYLIIVKQLLSRTGIAADRHTARRYIQFRRQQDRGKLPEKFLEGMERLAGQADFQLKCAIFFSFFAADASSVEPTAIEIREYYIANMKKYQTPGKADFSIFRAGSDDAGGRKSRELIIARLRQGEEFEALAQKYDPTGARGNISAGSRKKIAAAMAEMRIGEYKSVTTQEGIFMIKLRTGKAPEQLPLEAVSCYIREELSSVKLKNSLHRYITEILQKTPVKYHF